MRATLEKIRANNRKTATRKLLDWSRNPLARFLLERAIRRHDAKRREVAGLVEVRNGKVTNV